MKIGKQQNIWVRVMGLYKLVQLGVVPFLWIVSQMGDLVVEIPHSQWEGASEPGLLVVGEQPGPRPQELSDVR